MDHSQGPQEEVRYETVVVEKEKIIPVPVKQIVYKEHPVPKVKVEVREKIVEVPVVKVVEKIVEVPEYVERIRHVPVPRIVEVPKEVIQYVSKVEVKTVEREVEVPGKIIEVKKPVEVIQEKIVHRYLDEEVPTVVSQTFMPNVVESKQHQQVVKLKKYKPYVVPVEVFVPKPVDRNLIAGERREETRPVQMPPSQFNAQLKAANPGLSEEHLSNLYQRYADGSIPFFRGPGTTPIPPNPAGPSPGYS